MTYKLYNRLGSGGFATEAALAVAEDLVGRVDQCVVHVAELRVRSGARGITVIGRAVKEAGQWANVHDPGVFVTDDAGRMLSTSRTDPCSKQGYRKLRTSSRPDATDKQQDPDALTEREREVLELMVQGVTSNRRLAKELEVSENTVKFHVRNILDKLHLHNRAQVVAYALRNRIVVPPESDV